FRPGGEVVTATPAPAGLGTARVIGDGNGGAVIVADMARPGLVVLSDAWAAGWTVTVDGRPATAVRVDTAIRGVVVPAGRHRIVWSYTTPGLSSGAALSALGWVGWLGGAVAWVIRRRRPAPAEAAPSSMP
ncbi:MAG TPA: YfhO family protein, partial [Gaiellales bacterium]|nr:YfhO family protein [Gaiellales bacterium]